jgi:pimeloyl-ACP methyl ester carboxylesterase
MAPLAPPIPIGHRIGTRRLDALLVTFFVLTGCGGLFYQPSPQVFSDPARLHARWRNLSFPRPGGGSLAAALIDGDRTDSSRGLLIQFHGNAQNMTAHWLSLHWATQRGWTILAWDYSGYGGSDGQPSRQQIANDAHAFLEWVSDSILPGRRGPVVLVGQSLGSAILLQAFPTWRDRDKATLVLSEGGFPSYRSIAFDVVSRHWLTWIAYPLVPLLISNDKSPAPLIPKIAPTPFLIVSCSEDKVVPPSQQTKIQALAPSAMLWRVDGCRHIGAFRSDSLRTRLEHLVDSLTLRTNP